MHGNMLPALSTLGAWPRSFILLRVHMQISAFMRVSRCVSDRRELLILVERRSVLGERLDGVSLSDLRLRNPDLPEKSYHSRSEDRKPRPEKFDLSCAATSNTVRLATFQSSTSLLRRIRIANIVQQLRLPLV